MYITVDQKSYSFSEYSKFYKQLFNPLIKKFGPCIYFCLSEYEKFYYFHNGLIQGLFKKIPSLTQILDLSHTSHVHMGHTFTEIKAEIWIIFSSFIRSVCVLL